MIFIGSFCVVEIDPVFHYINICVGLKDTQDFGIMWTEIGPCI